MGDVKYGTPVYVKENSYISMIIANEIPNFLFRKRFEDHGGSWKTEVYYNYLPFEARIQLYDFTKQPDVEIN